MTKWVVVPPQTTTTTPFFLTKMSFQSLLFKLWSKNCSVSITWRLDRNTLSASPHPPLMLQVVCSVSEWAAPCPRTVPRPDGGRASALHSFTLGTGASVKEGRGSPGSCQVRRHGSYQSQGQAQAQAQDRRCLWPHRRHTGRHKAVDWGLCQDVAGNQFQMPLLWGLCVVRNHLWKPKDWVTFPVCLPGYQGSHFVVDSVPLSQKGFGTVVTLESVK